MAVLAVRGRTLAQPVLRRQRTRLREALPQLAEQGWAALAATMTGAEAAGYDTTALLADVAAQRELASAEQISDVLVWRLRQAGDLPADAHTMPLPMPLGSIRTGPSGQGPQPRGRR